MFLELAWFVIQIVLFLIHLIAAILAKVLTFGLVIYAIILIRRMFKTQKMVTPEDKAVLITGCDSGFGRQLALNLNTMGYRVYATVLNDSSTHNLMQNSVFKDRMIVWKTDVTLDGDVTEVYQNVVQDLQTNNCILWALVNNAGNGIMAQLEWVELADLEQIFEVNVLGMVRMTRTFLPLIKQSKGHIVNRCSQMGLFCTKGFGPYCMTKYAVKAFNDALRQEMHRFEVKVIGLYPGAYKKTNFIESKISSSDRIWDQMDDSLKKSYGNKEYYDIWKHNNLDRMKRYSGENIDLVLDAAIEAVVDPNPKISYSPNDSKPGQIMMFLYRILPCSILDIID